MNEGRKEGRNGGIVREVTKLEFSLTRSNTLLRVHFLHESSVKLFYIKIDTNYYNTNDSISA